MGTKQFTDKKTHRQQAKHSVKSTSHITCHGMSLTGNGQKPTGTKAH